MISYGAGDCVHGEDVVVSHVVLVAIVVEGYCCFAVVTGVDVEFVVEDMGGGVCCVDMGDEWFRHFGWCW